MKLETLQARKIIENIMGTQRAFVKSDDQLGLILKKRLTKKECAILNAEICEQSHEEVLATLKIDETRYQALKASAIKKIQNESIHKDFYTLGE